MSSNLVKVTSQNGQEFYIQRVEEQPTQQIQSVKSLDERYIDRYQQQAIKQAQIERRDYALSQTFLYGMFGLIALTVAGFIALCGLAIFATAIKPEPDRTCTGLICLMSEVPQEGRDGSII